MILGKAGRVAQISVIVAGSDDGAIYDTNDTATAAIGNQVYVIPHTRGVHVVNMPGNAGMVVAPGTGQTVAISYSVTP